MKKNKIYPPIINTWIEAYIPPQIKIKCNPKQLCCT